MRNSQYQKQCRYLRYIVSDRSQNALIKLAIYKKKVLLYVFIAAILSFLKFVKIVLPGGLDGKVFVQRPFCVFFEVVDY